MSEGYGADFEQAYGPDDRVTVLKSGIEVRRMDIPSFFKDDDAAQGVLLYSRWTRIGFPYADWAKCPNSLVQLIEALDPIDRLYHPKHTLF